MEKKVIIIVIGLVLILILLFSGGYFVKDNNGIPILGCGDGTAFGECSENKPYFCEDGVLVDKASICGCPEILYESGEFCISDYQTNPKEIDLDYTLRGEESTINLIVYKGMKDYLFDLPNTISSANGEQISRADFKLRNINNKEQRELILPLVTRIQNLADTQEDQARIAISLVQNIEFGWSGDTVKIGRNEINYSRYPYETLYDLQGVCGEKSELLAFLLKELNYGVALFYHSSENHEALGIECDDKYSLSNTGYCFVETTGPSIITDNQITYVGGLTLTSEPEYIFISNGEALGEDIYEYKDAKKLIKIRKNGINFIEKFFYNKLSKKYGLVDEYYSG